MVPNQTRMCKHPLLFALSSCSTRRTPVMNYKTKQPARSGQVRLDETSLLPALGLLPTLQPMQISFDLLELLLAILTRQIQLLLWIFVIKVIHPTHRYGGQWSFPLLTLQTTSQIPSNIHRIQIARRSVLLPAIAQRDRRPSSPTRP